MTDLITPTQPGRRPHGLGLLPTAPIGSHALPAMYLVALERIRRWPPAPGS